MFAGETLITEIKIGDRMKIPASQKHHPEHGHSGDAWMHACIREGKCVI